MKRLPQFGSVLIQFLFVALFSSSFNPALAAAAVYSFRSGKFFVTLRATQPGAPSENQTLLATVATSLTNAQDVLWTNFVTSLQNPPRRPQTVSVSDDGTFFIVQADSDLWKLVAKDKPPRTLKLRDGPTSLPWGYSTYDDSIACFDEFNGQPIVCLWRAASDQWQAFFVSEDRELHTTPELTAKWNRKTREDILAKIAQARAESLKRKLYEISPKLGGIANSIQPSSNARSRMIHYEFLALRHVPDDRALFVNLLEHRAIGPMPTNSFPAGMRLRWGGYSQLIGGGWFNSSGANPYTFESRTADRHEGDWLLAVFDQNPKINSRRRNAVDRELFYLSRVKGSIQLPVPIINKSGTLRIYLAPASRAGKDWTGDGIDKIEEELVQETRRNAPLTDRVDFIFDTVSPGPVRLKAIWDKRANFDDRTDAGPGDYETDWTAPINITAAATIKVDLICTNRSKEGGDNYYAADAVRAQNWRRLGDIAFLPPPKPPALQGKNQIFTAPADKWILESNVRTDGQTHGLVQISIVRTDGDDSKAPELLAIFSASSGQNRIINPYTLRLHDQDNAELTPSHTRTTDRYTYATFPNFPRQSQTFRLAAYARPENASRDRSTNTLFDLTLTNLWRAQ